MNLRVTACVAMAVGVGGFFASGCGHRPRAPAAAATSPPAMGLVPLPPMRAPEMRVALPGLALDLKWLDLDEFYPPGAKRIVAGSPPALELCAERRTKFPSTDLCASPDKNFVLFHDGMKRQREIFHWLLLLKKDATFPNAIFGTAAAFDVSWSEDSRRFAITHFIGRNSSEVFVVEAAGLERRSIDVRAQLRVHLPEHMLTAPMFVKAYRWTRDGRLVVRGLARSEHEPYEQFGCELLVAFPDYEAEPQATFLRGYILPQSEPAPRAETPP